MNTKQLVIAFVSLVMLAAAVLVVRDVLLHGQPAIKLKPAPPLAGVISQSLGVSGSSHSLPVAGKDYNLQDTHAFDNHSWVVTSVVPARANADTAVAVLRNKDGFFQVVLGPGTAFPESSLQSLPADVSRYLVKQGLVYGTSD
jgi:hypothetical protein